LETEAVSAPVEDDPFAALEGAEEEQGHDSLPPATEDTPIEAEVAVEATPDADHLAATEEEDPFAALADVEEP
ncbi:hypothetical protein, partial [Donghicola sp. XS_ASV15]|uniref:hypothetical protein n=1 Tax=Donghicola sp. XS_ASV15 TaxID=3241295 RepID=UPI00351575E3